MQRWRGYGAVPSGFGRSVVTIGVFDGVHRGHQATIGHAVKRAREAGLQAVVLTFDPHPSEVVRPGTHPAVLTEPRRKAELIAELDVDVLCVVPFTLEFSRLSPEDFVEANAWQASWFTSHDVMGLANLMGGEEVYGGVAAFG